MDSNETKIANLIEHIAKELVDVPDAVKVSSIPGGQTVVFELSVDKADLGKVIGKQGNTARSIRTLVNAVSVKLGKRSILEIIE